MLRRKKGCRVDDEGSGGYQMAMEWKRELSGGLCFGFE